MLRCYGCPDLPSLRFFPLCAECARSLVPCPPLCPECLQLGCQKQCNRPWRGSSPLASIAAGYLLVGASYPLLRAWKRKRGFILHRRLLTLPQSPPQGVEAVIPVPQTLERSWKLEGSPALALARDLSRRFRLPLIPALSTRAKRRQAGRSLQERLESTSPFEARPLPYRSVYLVDDFITSGATCSAAARALISRGVVAVHVYCLGFRPSGLSKVSRQLR